MSTNSFPAFSRRAPPQAALPGFSGGGVGTHGAGIIASDDDYARLLAHLYPEGPVDVHKWQEWAEEQRQGDVVLWFTVDGFFWFARRLLGIERHLYAFYDQPELMHRINADLTDWILLVIEQVCSICTPDFMTFAEDMSYNNGPMLSKDLFDEFMRPYYDRIIPARNRSRGQGPRIHTDKHGWMPYALPSRFSM